MNVTRKSFLVNRKAHESNRIYYESRFTNDEHDLGGANGQIGHR
jgi:hypothetical protein